MRARTPLASSPRRPKLLIVDDGDRYAELLHQFLRDYDYATRCTLPGPCWSCPERHGCTLTHAHDAAEVTQALAQHPDVDVVLLDLTFELPAERLLPLPPSLSPSGPDPERRRRLQGLAILADVRRRHGALPVVLMTSEEALLYEDAAAALAVDEYLTLAGADAFDARALGLLIERVLSRRRVEVGSERYVWGAALGRLKRDAEVLARTSLPMLLLGETGSGKSALAERVIHPASRRSGPFVSVDLAALPPTLVAAELFGTARGAYSGAVERPGRFEHAHGGTLFLDEIGNVPLEVQRMLLLALEAGRVTRLGESTPRPVDVKLIAATHADLQAAVRAGSFRADLYARLNPAASLRLVPLRERLEDLEALMQSFVRRAFTSGADRGLLGDYLVATGLAGESRAEPVAELVLGRDMPPAVPMPPPNGVAFVLGSASLEALRAHRWPGNVRELERLVTSAAAFALADAVWAAEAGRSPAGVAARLIPIPPKLVRELLGGTGGRMTTEGDGRLEVRVEPAATLHQQAQSLERQVFERLYHETGGDFAAMAERLLTGDGADHARRVRLRFNQLGLRARPRARTAPGTGTKSR
jgi:DNA-binding NtrC family response regulator